MVFDSLFGGGLEVHSAAASASHHEGFLSEGSHFQQDQHHTPEHQEEHQAEAEMEEGETFEDSMTHLAEESVTMNPAGRLMLTDLRVRNQVESLICVGGAAAAGAGSALAIFGWADEARLKTKTTKHGNKENIKNIDSGVVKIVRHADNSSSRNVIRQRSHSFLDSEVIPGPESHLSCSGTGEAL